jgi:hypothetical protein
MCALKEKAAIKVNVLPATVDPESLMWVEAYCRTFLWPHFGAKSSAVLPALCKSW